jgi:dihydrofolate synthase/folylpolyglutamate synthase
VAEPRAGIRDYAAALGYLYALEPRGVQLEIDRIQQALALRGHPERRCRFVHVAGSNGKGSVAAMVEAGLRAAGYRTGLYTSPHLHRFVERIRIAGRPVSQGRVTRTVESLRGTLEAPGAPQLTFFEMTTVLAFECFAEAHCDVAVLEVGLGGRLDATNVIEPELSVITRLALEHTSRLGTTLEEIAGEKAGILKRSVPAVVAEQPPEANRVIEQRAAQLDVVVNYAGRDFAFRRDGRGRVHVDLGDRSLGPLRAPLPGPHQRENLAVATASLVRLRERGFHVPEEAIARAVARLRWPGRLEWIRGSPRFLLDASHNPDGCAALARYLADVPRRGRRVLIFSAMDDKEHERMLAAFDDQVDERIYTAPASLSRAASPATFAAVRAGEVAASVPEALSRARCCAGTDGLVIVAGSIFLMAEARAMLRGVRTDPPIAM